MIGIVGVFVVGIGLGYLLLTVVLGVLVSREQPTVEPPADGPGDAHPTSVYFLIAALDEELVIADTVRSALGQGGAHVVVVDDGSADDTGAAPGVDPQRVTVVRRSSPRRGSARVRPSTSASSASSSSSPSPAPIRPRSWSA
ncbi:MAG: hypothetical protein R2746_02985 [Acidimicrobiales bacterium]